VLPGTRLVTVGGAIANDVHGKNHHQTGTFGDHVLSIRLQRTDGEEIVCGPAERADWFAATVGGLGLTGLIVEAELQLRRVPGPWLETETVAYAGLDEFFRLSDESHPDWEHAVSWIDCTAGDAGRGLFLRARPAADQHGAWRGPRVTLPVVPPVSLVNRLTLRPLNQLYWWLNQRHLGGALSTTNRSCFRSMPLPTGTAPTDRPASISTSASCRARPRRWRSRGCWRRSPAPAMARCWLC
jgi:FAD/FMN-containing dehydrogenase